jgi:type I restriction enzyme M protein
LWLDRSLVKKTDKILFVKIENDGFDLGAQRRAIKGTDLPSASQIVSVYKKQIVSAGITNLELGTKVSLVTRNDISGNGDYNLSGERYIKRIAQTSDYDMVELYSISELQGGYAFKSEELLDEKAEKCLPVIKIGNVDRNGKIALDSVQYFPYDDSLKRYLIKENDVLVAMTGATVGKVAVSEYNNLLLNQRVGLIRATDKSILSSFLSKLLLNEKFYYYCQKTAGGGAQGNISPNEILKFQIPLPPLPIQEEIVAEIGSYEKIIDGARQVVKNYKPRIDIDPEWEMVELSEVCDIGAGGTPSRNIPEYWNGKISWVGSTVCKDVEVIKAEEYITELGLNKSAAKLFAVGTTLIALVGATIGKTGYLMFPCTTNQNIAGLSPKSNEILDKKYLFYIAQSLYPKFMELAEGKFRMANLSFIKTLKIPLPDLAMQQEIVKRIDSEKNIVKGNINLITAFEQKIKDRIAKVWGE